MNNKKLEDFRQSECFIDVTFGSWCGVLMRKKVAAKYATLQKKFVNDVKDLLSDNLDEIEVQNWSLDYSTGNQVSFKYYIPTNDKEKQSRIDVLKKPAFFDSSRKTVYKFSDYKEMESMITKKEL